MCRLSGRENNCWDGKFVLPFIYTVKNQTCFCSVSLKQRKAGRENKISFNNYLGSEPAAMYHGCSTTPTPGSLGNGAFKQDQKI